MTPQSIISVASQTTPWISSWNPLTEKVFCWKKIQSGFQQKMLLMMWMLLMMSIQRTCVSFVVKDPCKKSAFQLREYIFLRQGFCALFLEPEKAVNERL